MGCGMAKQHMASDWEQCFSATYLQRARAYVRAGRVERLDKTGTGWEAIVSGSSVYRVFVPAAGNGSFAEHATCTCPWFAKGHLCKHIAAVCYAIEAEAAGGTSARSPTGEVGIASDNARREAEGQAKARDEGALKSSTLGQQANDMLAHVSDADVRAFLAQALREDERLAYRFRSQFMQRDVKAAQRDLRHELSAIKKAYTYRGWIDYRSALSFADEYLGAAEQAIQPFARRGDTDNVLALTGVLIASLRTVHIDDSDGFFYDAMGLCRQTWDAVLDALASDPAKRADIARCLCALSYKVSDAKREEDIDWFLIDAVDEYVAERFAGDAACAATVVELADRRIEQARLAHRQELATVARGNGMLIGGAGDSFTYAPVDYTTPRWAAHRVRAMYTAGASVQETMAYGEPFRASYDVLDALAGVLADAGDAAGAMRMFEEALQSAGRAPTARRFSLRLRELYREYGETEKLRDLLGKLLADAGSTDSNPSAPQLLDELHAITPEQSWSQVRDAALERMSSGDARCDCLAAEGLVDRLASELAQGGVRYRSPASYESLLIADHADMLVAWFADDARRAMGGYASGRKAYRKAVEKLRHLASLPGGATLAREIADEWKRQYSRRPAMLEELAHAGFA